MWQNNYIHQWWDNYYKRLTYIVGNGMWSYNLSGVQFPGYYHNNSSYKTLFQLTQWRLDGVSVIVWFYAIYSDHVDLITLS